MSAPPPAPPPSTKLTAAQEKKEQAALAKFSKSDEKTMAEMAEVEYNIATQHNTTQHNSTQRNAHNTTR
jgi:hypothetical protein